jgi:site-specific DNA-methyltransferase (adenine-specific)
MTGYDLINADCLEAMSLIPDGSVDAIVTDPPYALTACEWDRAIDWQAWWAEARRVAKPDAAFILFASQPFTTDLINSNRDQYRYELIWSMNIATRFLDANRRPLLNHQSIQVFGDKIKYNRIDWDRTCFRSTLKPGSTTYFRDRGDEDHPHPNLGDKINSLGTDRGKGIYRGDIKGRSYTYGLTECPKSVLVGFPRKGNFNASKRPYHHPSAKPVALMEWLVKTYSPEGGTVLDTFIGSGTTGVACLNTGRNFIGMESDPRYFSMSTDRIAEARAKSA